MSLESPCNAVLRQASPDDLTAVMLLYKSAIGSPGLPWTEDYPNDRTLAADFAAGGLYVLSENGAPVAAASVVPENEYDEMDCWAVCDGTQRELARIVVAPQKRGRGYAGKMLSLLLDELAQNGCRAVHLLVATGNEAAIRLYRSLGFSFLGKERLPDFGGDFYACEKILKPPKN